mmetsp:Transcript_59227/g.118854  ORF Transcript_59227/g.118854 Transcript_59227/m.118854 type:complete len:460 (+) Transcript_59227:143-1522(+)
MASLGEDDNEIKFARKLASGESRKRKQAIAGLQAWLRGRSAASPQGVLPELELRKLWRGLFFCMWLADKAPVQNELAQKIAGLVHCFKNAQGVHSWLLICGMTIRGEWGRLDKYRLDKFYILLRIVVRESFVWLRNVSWDEESVGIVGAAMDEAFFAHPQPNGIRLHIADLFLDELFAVNVNSKNPSWMPDTEAVLSLLRPLISRVATVDDKTFFSRTLENVVLALPTKVAASGSDVDLGRIQVLVFELASASDTRDRCRKDLYAAHSLFQSSTRLNSTTDLEALTKEALPDDESSKTNSLEVDVVEKAKKKKKRPVQAEELGAAETGEEEASAKKAKKKKKRKQKEEIGDNVEDEVEAREESEDIEKQQNRRVSFGSNKSKVYQASVKDLKESNPLLPVTPTKKGCQKVKHGTAPCREVKGILSTKSPRSASAKKKTKDSAKKTSKTLTPRGKASDFF